MKTDSNHTPRLLLHALLVTLFIVGFAFYVTGAMEPVLNAELEEGYALLEEYKSMDSTEEEVIGQIALLQRTTDILSKKTAVYRMAIVCILVMLAAGVGFMLHTGLRFMAFLAAVCVLMTIGVSYQYVFLMDSKHLIFIAATIAAGIFFLLFLRGRMTVSNRWYALLTILIFGLLLANLIFGRTINNARLWIIVAGISIQPGEFVKFLLILMGAYAHMHFTRSLVFCATSLISCVTLIYLNDLGNAAILFAVFVFMTYYLFDNKILSLSLILFAAAALVLLLKFKSPEALSRFTCFWKAMRTDVDQTTIDNLRAQSKLLKALLFGGFRGLGFENLAFLRDNVIDEKFIYQIHGDLAIAGVQAVYGVPFLAAVLVSYFLLVIQASCNTSVHPAAYLILAQFSMFVTLQVFLNFAGSIDAFPFTGVVAPLISDGGSAMLAFGCMLGACAAALCPKETKTGPARHNRRVNR